MLDANQRPVPDGVVGTISISGDGLAKGYWGTSDETLAKTGKTFPYSDHLGLRLCQPGDLGRYYADGIIEFLGREDFQVKIKGYRVEVAEVQKACEASTLVKLAFVIPVGPNGRKLLCAFILPDDDNSTEEMLRVDVERACKELVPWYMKPTFIHRIDDDGLSKLLSANQKMDRTKMEARHNEIAKTGGSAASADGFRDNTVATPPRSDAERKMLQLWKDVLPDGCGGTLGIYDHFFELGGDSMSGSGLVGRVNAAFGTTMLLQEILSWDNMCIASLTSHVTGTVSDVGGAEGDLPDGVTALKSCTGRPPLFLIAPVSGNSHCYRMLARELPTDQPVYGLSCPGLDSPDIELSTLIHEWTIPSLAAHFIGLIQEVLTIRHGRSCHFSLGGWSFGGVVAFELSRILPADLKCLALCMIDSPGPIGPPSRPPVDSHGRQQQQQQQQVGSGASDSIAMLLAFELDYQLSRDSGAMPNPGDDDGGDEKVAAFPAGISTERARTIVLQRLQQARVIPMDFTHQQFKRMVEVYAANLEALQCFRPTPEAVKECPPRSQRGEVYLFRAINTNQHLVQGYAGAPALDFGWLKVGLPASSVRVRLYDGDHFAVCQSAGVPMIKMFLQGALEIRARAFTRTLVETSNARVKRQHFERQRSSQGDFQMGAGSSSDQDAHHAADEAMAQLRKALFPVWPPDLIVVAVSTSTYNPDTLLAILRDTALTGGCALHVCSSLFGGFSEEGLKPLCLLGFVDHAGTFGTGWAGLPADAGVCTAELARSAGVAATMAASAAKNAVGGGVGQPSLAIVTPGVQGFEEDILAGIRSMLPGVPICGGTAADDGLLDDAKRFVAGSRDARVSFSPDSAAAGPNDGGPAAVHSAALQRGVVVSLLWPSVPTSVLFSSAYNPMETASGTVTKASGRILHEIGGKPAAQVYARWSRSADIAAAVADQGTRPAPILAGSTLHPLAKIVRGPAAEKRNAHDHHSTRLSAGGFSAQKTEVDFHSLIHPKAVLAGDSLELFATLEEGDTICCLEATVDELDRHTEEVLGLNAGSEDGNGALLVYCGGCALALKTEARLAGVARRLRAALRNQPFMGLVTYGEQGIDPYGNAQHANLMYAIVRFGVKPSASANHV